MTVKQLEVIQRYTCESSYKLTTFEQFKKDLLSGHSDIIIWEPFEHCAPAFILECIEGELCPF